uniref:Protein groucho (Trinotate prediction) n=1 Tax=Henneguya salminicola TaxID=69463 RepID=A0A6G3MJZ9_HENSL
MITLFLGGLDATARCWDSRDGKQVHSFSFPTQVFSLCISPTSDYIVVGLENKTIELCYSKESGQRFGERHVFKVHDSCVLTVKISNSGKWLISSSKDNYTNCVRIPQGIPLFLTRENASILCTDISPDDKYIITGGGEKKATIYECVY